MKPGSPLLRYCFPDAAMMVALFTLFYGLAFGDGPSRLFRDSDTGWHIRTGESILAGHPLPRRDPYSFTRSGQPWYAWEWGADVLMGLAHSRWGTPGIAWMYSVGVAIVVWMWFRLHWAVEGNFFLACAMASPLITTLQLHWLARPHVLGWLLCVVAALAFERAPRRWRWRHGLAFAALGALWANVHASFFLLAVIAAIYAVGAVMDGLLWTAGSSDAGWYAKAGLFGMAGTFGNPYGWELHRHVAAYLGDQELLSRIGEYQSFNFHAEGVFQILLTVGLAGAGAMAAIASRRVAWLLLCGGLLAMSLRSARVLPLLALVALPLANGALTQAVRRAGFREAVQRRLVAFLDYSARVRLLDGRCRGWAIAPLALAAAFGLLLAPANSARVGFPAKEFPVAAAAAVERLPADARLLAPDRYGGYLIYRFQGSRKVFFDGRSDFYGVAFMKNYIRLIEARPGWREQVTEFGFTHALLPNNYSLLAGLEQWGWKRLYRDDVATLLAKPAAAIRD